MNVFDTSALEETLKKIIREIGVGGAVYNNRPKSTPESVTDFVVVSASGNISDMGCYASCRVYIMLYAKDLEHVKNSKRLSVMYQKLVSKFPASYGDYEFETTPTIVSDAPDDYGYHARVLQFKTIIKVS